MSVAINACDHFILSVSRANYSQYLSAKKSYLDAASRGEAAEGEEAPADNAQLNVIKEKYLEYPGITDAIALYESLVESVSADEAAALAYVAAVNDLVAKLDTLTKEQIRTALANAENLQKTGNVIGVDGVTEANIALNNIKSDFELTEGYVNQFANVVKNIGNATSKSDIFYLANEAFDVIVNAEKYEGVNADDKAKLDAAINDYNAKVRALNESFAAANEVACGVVSASSGATADDTAIGNVIALIKKFFE